MLLSLALTLLIPEQVAIPNPGFEQVGGEVCPEVVDFIADTANVPKGWVADQWGSPFSKFECCADTSVAHAGSASLRLRSEAVRAKIGVRTALDLRAGQYELTFFAKCDRGKRALLEASLGQGYSAPAEVGEDWTQVRTALALSEDAPKAELAIRLARRQGSTVWLDDVSLITISPRPKQWRYIRDTRPQPPKTLLFSPITVEQVTAEAAEWARRGFGGFLFSGIMSDWSSDIWATDGDPSTRGSADKTFQALRPCNQAGAPYGLRNFIKVAFYSHLPFWLDQAGWARLAENFRQAAIMARDTGCPGLAIDTEYVSEQYEPQWEGYNYDGYTVDDLHRAARQRGAQLVQAMLAEYPTLELLTLPEGIKFYGPLYEDLFQGMLEAMVEADAPGGLHLLTESTYSERDYERLLQTPAALETLILWGQPEKVRRYWQEKCSICLGGWPLGYYRDIKDESGKTIGYAGRKEIFGDELIGSYADNGPRFSLEEFRTQMAGLSAASKRYNWIYAHGHTWYPTPGELEIEGKTPREVEQARARRAVPNLEEYWAIVREHYLMAPAE